MLSSKAVRSGGAVLLAAGAVYCTMSGSNSTARALFGCFKDCTPAFAVSGKNIEVCHTPSEFYRALMNGIANAKTRIVLASLYLGSGKLEKDMVELLGARLAGSAGDGASLRVHILLDHSRGSRGSAAGSSSRHMLLPLLQQFGGGGDTAGRLRLSLYHTPQLRGYLKKYMPDRFNELLGVQHIKVYLFDDTIVLSGANLSNDYFTNRQDRCLVVKGAPELCDFFEQLVQCIGSFSLQVMPDNSEVMCEDCDVHPYHGHHADFGSLVKERIESIMTKYASMGDIICSGTDVIDTWIYPTVQMGPFGVDHDVTAMEQLLKQAEQGSAVSLSTAYFNLTDDYANWIVTSSAARYDIVSAAPQANGFYGAAGVAGAVPHAYTLFEKAFFRRIVATRQTDRIKLFEYIRDGWTFHAKGLWWYLPREILPSMTLIGSSNFGYRSAHRDLEAQVAIVTESEELRSALEQEKQNIFSRCYQVTDDVFHKPDRHMPFWVRLVATFVKYYA